MTKKEDYTNEYIDAFRAKVKELGFQGAEFLDALGNDDIRDNINGIGSTGMPEQLRTALDNLCPSFVYPSHVHDLTWVFACDGSEEAFLQSNAEFEANCILMAKDQHAWYSPMRYIAIHRAKQFRAILDKFGQGAYDATERKPLP